MIEEKYNRQIDKVPDMQEHGVGQIWEWYMRVYRYMISG
jgi:hypothetical protein